MYINRLYKSRIVFKIYSIFDKFFIRLIKDIHMFLYLDFSKTPVNLAIFNKSKSLGDYTKPTLGSENK